MMEPYNPYFCGNYSTKAIKRILKEKAWLSMNIIQTSFKDMNKYARSYFQLFISTLAYLNLQYTGFKHRAVISEL